MNLFFFNQKTLKYERVRDNVDKLNTDEIKSTIVEYFYENSLDTEAGDIVSIESFEILTTFLYRAECKEQSFVFVESEQQRVDTYSKLVEKWDKVTITTTIGESYEF